MRLVRTAIWIIVTLALAAFLLGNLIFFPDGMVANTLRAWDSVIHNPRRYIFGAFVILSAIIIRGVLAETFLWSQIAYFVGAPAIYLMLLSKADYVFDDAFTGAFFILCLSYAILLLKLYCKDKDAIGWFADRTYLVSLFTIAALAAKEDYFYLFDALGILLFSVMLLRHFLTIIDEPESLPTRAFLLAWYLDLLLSIGALILIYGKVYSIIGMKSDGKITHDLADGLYLSAITWATVGYGDITPTDIGRGFAAAEALTGIISMALLISGLSALITSLRARTN